MLLQPSNSACAHQYPTFTSPSAHNIGVSKLFLLGGGFHFLIPGYIYPSLWLALDPIRQQIWQWSRPKPGPTEFWQIIHTRSFSLDLPWQHQASLLEDGRPWVVEPTCPSWSQLQSILSPVSCLLQAQRSIKSKLPGKQNQQSKSEPMSLACRHRIWRHLVNYK